MPAVRFLKLRGRGSYCRDMIAIQRKIVIDEHDAPQEVITPRAQICERSKALGLDLHAPAVIDLR